MSDDRFQMEEPVYSGNFRIFGHRLWGYHIGLIAQSGDPEGLALGWSFHTTGELEYLVSTLTKELEDIARFVAQNPDTGILNNQHTSQPYMPRRPQTPTGLALRFFILKRDQYRCQICGRTAPEHGVVLEVDHRVPRAKGGTDDLTNLWTLCFECNRGKRDTDL